LEAVRKEGFEQGHKQGLNKGFSEGYEEYLLYFHELLSQGLTTDEIKQRLDQEYAFSCS